MNLIRKNYKFLSSQTVNHFRENTSSPVHGFDLKKTSMIF